MRRSNVVGWRGLVVGLAAVTVMSTACGTSDGEPSAQTEETTVDNGTGQVTGDEWEVPDELVDRAVERLDTAREALQIDEPVLLAPSECRLVFAWIIDELDGATVPFVVQPDGSVVDGTDTTLAEIVDTCYFASDAGEPEAGPMADLVMSFGDPPLASVLAGPTFANSLADLGVESVEPVVTTAEGATTLEFYAYDPELDDFYRATAVRSADASFSAEYELLG